MFLATFTFMWWSKMVTGYNLLIKIIGLSIIIITILFVAYLLGYL